MRPLTGAHLHAHKENRGRARWVKLPWRFMVFSISGNHLGAASSTGQSSTIRFIRVDLGQRLIALAYLYWIVPPDRRAESRDSSLIPVYDRTPNHDPHRCTMLWYSQLTPKSLLRPQALRSTILTRVDYKATKRPAKCIRTSSESNFASQRDMSVKQVKKRGGLIWLFRLLHTASPQARSLGTRQQPSAHSSDQRPSTINTISTLSTISTKHFWKSVFHSIYFLAGDNNSILNDTHYMESITCNIRIWFTIYNYENMFDNHFTRPSQGGI